MPNRNKRNERLQVMLSESELKVIDGWRFDQRMPSRAAAIRELIRLGLDASGYDLNRVEQALGQPHVASTDEFSIVDDSRVPSSNGD